MVNVVKEARDVKEKGGADQATGVGSADVVLEAEASIYGGGSVPTPKLSGRDKFEVVNVIEDASGEYLFQKFT
jgi:hypothetical protein